MSIEKKGISVIMPTYNQGAFIRIAISSLFAQTFQNWELIIVNDGCTDDTEEIVNHYLFDNRIKYLKNEVNLGLGRSLNKGLQHAVYQYISYLPSDDIFYSNHLESLYNKIIHSENAVLFYAGVNYGYRGIPNPLSRISSDKIQNTTLQLVQILHKKNLCKWVEREELVTDNLDIMFLNNLAKTGTFVFTGVVSCEWVDHPYQRHKIIQERYLGGIYLYKKYYNIISPIKFQSTKGNYIDEIDFYKKFRKIPEKQDQLKILIVGELAYNPERICALENLGHKLYGLWIDRPLNYNTIGPLPFGNITDINIEDFENQINEIKPDIIYALLN